MCIFIERYMDVFMPVLPISCSARRRCFWGSSRVLGLLVALSGPCERKFEHGEGSCLLGLSPPSQGGPQWRPDLQASTIQ